MGNCASICDRNRHYRQHGAKPTRKDRPSNLKIVIVGAGIGGLSAAIGLRRNGHEVHLFEQSAFASDAGAAVHLSPNSNGILRRWGIYAEEFGADPMNRLIELLPDGQIVKDIDLREPNKRWQHPWHLVHRVNLHETLKKLATSPEGEGIPAKLHTSSKVMDVDTAQGLITLANGERVTADVIIGADGIYSVTRKCIKDSKLFSSGKAAFRFLIPRNIAEADPVTAPLVEHHNTLRLWFGDDRRIVMYPCNDNKLLNFVCIHPDTESHATKIDEWNKQGSVEQVLKVFEVFDPVVKALIAKVDPSTLKVWQLLDMEQMPTLTKGKLVLLGDAGHPFTPHQGQGAGQAIEDAAALTTVFPRGTKPTDVFERLKLYEAIRYERAHTIQNYSRLAGSDWINGKPQVEMTKFTNYNFGHDEIDHSRNLFNNWLWSRNPNACWRMPLGFGPLPAPRPPSQYDHPACCPPIPTNSTAAEFTSMIVRFKTSRTFLETLFPTAQFRFKEANTVAMASFAATRASNNEHATLRFYVHGVQYLKSDGSTVNGTYMPVVFESSGRSGKEETSLLPKVLCDIELSTGNNFARVTAAWRGTTFADITADDIQDEEKSERNDEGVPCQEESKDEEGILLYRYIPAVNSPGKTATEYPCLIPRPACTGDEKPKSVRITKVMRPRPGSVRTATTVKIDGHNWEKLPTLHHIASTLADVPIYEMVEAKVVVGTGMADDSTSCMRIE
ncbi:FAD/NAD(P)-binding domain-containing protein [Copromyces sp. CBS 386.78]|nr:FAD/NAD(P)-binding domain-containing protein [Copromyces sp. CBS 386.78]